MYAALSPATGSGIELFGQSNTTYANPGVLHLFSYGATGVSTYLDNFEPSSSSFHHNVVVSNAGQTLVGHDMDLPLAVAGDVLTVLDQQGFYDATDATRRAIDGNTTAGLLSINSKVNSTNGTTIEMYGTSNGIFPGQVHYVSSMNTGGIGHEFQNYNGSGWQPLFRVFNNADLQTGNSIYMDILGDGARTIFGNSTTGWLGLCSGHGGGGAADGAYIQLFTNGIGGALDGTMDLVATSSTASTINFLHSSGGVTKSNMTINSNGKVVIAGPGLNVSDINTATATDYGLYVGIGILSEHVRVANHTGSWADFVFNKDYELMPLDKVEDYVKANKHLPEIPSAAEVEKDGIDVQNMDSKLLQKVEELTLYVIQQQKRIDELEKKVDKAN